MNTLKLYMAFDGACGPAEGAVLVVAHHIREAKKMVYPELLLWGAEYADIRVRLLRDSQHMMALADQKKLDASEPHVIDSPTVCDYCEYWGYGLEADGRTCPHCEQYAGDLLVKLYRDYEARQTAVIQEPL